MQYIMQLIRIAHVRPGFPLNLLNRCGIELSDLFKYGFRKYATHLDRARPTLFERRIVEIRVRVCVQDFVRELRRHRCIYRDAANTAAFDPGEYAPESFHIHCLSQNVLHDLIDEW